MSAPHRSLTRRGTESNGGEGFIFEAVVWTIVPWFVDSSLRSENDGEERDDEFSSGIPAASVAP
ncbi:hypothetical protein GCM10027567_14220 [Spongiibacter taiwanensis]